MEFIEKIGTGIDFYESADTFLAGILAKSHEAKCNVYQRERENRLMYGRFGVKGVPIHGRTDARLNRVTE